MNPIEKRLEIIEAELAEMKKLLRPYRPGIIGRTSPDFLDTMFGIHARSLAFPSLMQEIIADREAERSESYRLRADDSAL